MKTKLIAIAFILVCMIAQDSQAQIFGRFRGSAKQAICPTGGCPTVTTSQQGHWSYSGTIESHLKSAHGVESAGMSSEQKLTLHDSLHTGKSVPQITIVTAEIQTVASERRKFHRVLMQAARNARADGKITSFQLAAFSLLSRNPASMDKIQAVIHETAISEGLATATAINWEQLIKFIEKLIPLIIQLIGLFG